MFALLLHYFIIYDYILFFYFTFTLFLFILFFTFTLLFNNIQTTLLQYIVYLYTSKTKLQKMYKQELYLANLPHAA